MIFHLQRQLLERKTSPVTCIDTAVILTLGMAHGIDLMRLQSFTRRSRFN